jgi:dihydropyrimidinase
MQSNADYSVYDGREIHGWPRFTVSRGDVVLADGQVIAEPGRGQLLRRDPTAGL